MSLRANGSYIGPRLSDVSQSAAGGVWSARDVARYSREALWPSAPGLPSGLAVDVEGDQTLDISWTAGSGTNTDYVVEYTPSGGSASTVKVGSASTSYQITGLTNGTTYSVRVAGEATGLVGGFTAAVTGTPNVPSGITPNTDARARFYLPSGATAFSVGASSSTGYIRLTDGTNFGAVGSGTAGSAYGNAYTNTASISSLTGTPVIQLFSCDAAGNPSGVLYGISLTGTTQAVDAIDISGITTMTLFSAYSSSAYGGNIYKFGYSGSSSLPSSITEIRAVGVSFGGPQASAPYVAGSSFYYAPGVDITDQDLDASALDQFYTDLATATTNGQQIIVRLNPGVSGDTPSIATAKNYAVYGS